MKAQQGTEDSKPTRAEVRENAKVYLLAGLFLLIGLVFVAVLSTPVWIAYLWNESEIGTRFYFVGVVSYWIYSLILVLIDCCRMLSTGDRNLAQIGMRRNIFTHQMVRKDAIDYKSGIALFLFGVFLMSLLSWLTYPIEIILFIKKKISQSRRPAELKRIEWTLKNLPMKAADVVRIDLKCSEIMLGRALTSEEHAEYQNTLTDLGIDVNIADVLKHSPSSFTIP